MAQTHTAAMGTIWNGAARYVWPIVYWKLDGTNWTAINTYTTDIEISRGIYDSMTDLPAMGAAQPAEMSITLDNSDERFSPASTASPYYSYIRYGYQRIPIFCEMSVDNMSTFYRQFTGYISGAQEWHTSNPTSKGVRLTCIDNSDSLQQYKVTTTLQENIPISSFMGTLLATAGGLSSTIDASVNTISYAWGDDENIWQECQDLALADGGMFYFDEGGTATFRRMTAWVERADSLTSQATFTAADVWSYDSAYHWSNAYTGVTVEYASRGPGEPIVMYSTEDPIEIAPSGTATFKAQYRYPAQEVQTPLYLQDWSAVSAAGSDLGSYLAVTMTQSAQQASVTLSNTHPYHRMYVLNFQIRGVPIMGDEAHEIAQDAAGSILTTYWRGADADTKRLAVRGNPYLQTEEQARRLAGYLRDRLQYPRQILQWRAQACPYLQLGDRVTVKDADTGLNTECYLLGIKQTYAYQGMYEGEYVGLPVSNVYGYDSYFIVGTDTYSDSASDRLFY